MKNVLIISTSLRVSSNSALLAGRFAQGVLDSGKNAEIVSLAGKSITFCQGCLACQKTKQCVIHDDAAIIAQKMGEADIIVFATPVYYYEMSGQMKTMLDRANPLFTADYKFRDVYLLACAAEQGTDVFQGVKNGLEGWLACFPQARLADTVFAGGATTAGAVKNMDAMEQAYQLGLMA